MIVQRIQIVKTQSEVIHVLVKTGLVGMKILVLVFFFFFLFSDFFKTSIDNTDKDVNECIGQGTGNNCTINAVCTNLPGGFSCSCPSGFFGNGYINCQGNFFFFFFFGNYEKQQHQ